MPRKQDDQLPAGTGREMSEVTTTDVDALLETAKGQEGRERLRTLTWIWNELNARAVSDADLEYRLAREVTLEATEEHGDLMPAGESLFMSHGLWCLVAATPYGHRCGYVRVPDDHPWQGLEFFDDIDGTKRDLVAEGPMAGAPDFDEALNDISHHLSVHGGISYSGETIVPGAPEGWWFGFDCAHSMDGIDPALNVVNFQKYLFDEKAEIRTNAYVREQCEHLARQIGDWQ